MGWIYIFFIQRTTLRSNEPDAQKKSVDTVKLPVVQLLEHVRRAEILADGLTTVCTVEAEVPAADLILMLMLMLIFVYL